MNYFEDKLGDFRGKVYESFRNIISKMSIGNKVTFEPHLTPFFYTDSEGCTTEFNCTSIEMDQYGELTFWSDLNMNVSASMLDTDTLCYLHDEIVATYALDNEE